MAADDLSVPTGLFTRVDPVDAAVGGLEPNGESISDVETAYACMSGRSKAKNAPAAAIIWGLSGLDTELAWLPFLECCMPWTIEV